jgi:outer membrane murein-binding lipoprotein Lpp
MPVQKLPYLGVLKLRDLPFVFYNCDTQPYAVSITDHPYYRSLEENDPSIFLSYYKIREHLSGFCEYSWEAFLALKEKIRLDGWQPGLGPPITVRDIGQLDGTHRLSILCHLHGPDTLVMIIDGIITYPVPLQQDLIQLFSNAASQLALDKTNQISTLENALAHCKNERDYAISQIQAAKDQVSDLESALAYCKNERDYAISQIQAAKDQLEMILSEKKALLSSNSWKLTKPLRLIKDGFFTNS